MKMMLPAASDRRLVDRSLVAFFRGYGMADFNRAVATLARFYHLPRPKVEWFEYLDWGTTGGRTYQNGKIHLVHPENWKNGRKYNSERRWIQTVYHEMAHYLFWADAEKKADTFAYRMVRGTQNHTRNHRNHTRTSRTQSARHR
jgi:predicted SprT family Zn-dependent metalloprotease